MKSLKLLVVTLSVAMLMAVSACSTPPPPPPPPTPIPVYTPSFTENEVIAIARESKFAYQFMNDWDRTWNDRTMRRCWWKTDELLDWIEALDTVFGVDKEEKVTHFESATLKKNGVWVVKVQSSIAGAWQDDCTFLVDDATGKVVQN